MFSLRSLFRSNKQKYAATRFPPNWPSYLHNKCNDPICPFPNPPQTLAGVYACQGCLLNGKLCRGTYEVTPSMARSALKAELVPTTLRTSPTAPPPVRPPRPEQSKRSSKRASKRALKNKALPPPPGLGLYNIQARRAAAAPADLKPQPASNTHYHCYAAPVQSYYAPPTAYANSRPRRAMNHH